MSKVFWMEFKPDHFIYNGKWISNWFSNMVIHPIYVEARLWPSVENYYQAMKTEERDIQEWIRNMNPSQSKREGRKLILRPDWEQIKESKMKHALDIKFAKQPWFDLLMATGDEPIIEWNNWGDQYWGVTEDGVGQNRLGILLMDIRKEYQAYRSERSNPFMSDEQREKQ